MRKRIITDASDTARHALTVIVMRGTALKIMSGGRCNDLASVTWRRLSVYQSLGNPDAIGKTYEFGGPEAGHNVSPTRVPHRRIH